MLGTNGDNTQEIIYEIGRNSRRKDLSCTNRRSSGGCIPAEHGYPIDYDSLTAIGSMIGSGGLIVMDEIIVWWISPVSSWSLLLRILRKMSSLSYRDKEDAGPFK